MTRCIELLLDKITEIREQIDWEVLVQSVQQHIYEELLGRVCHASMGVPGSAGLFTTLNMALKDKSR